MLLVYFSRAGENWQVGYVERGNTAIMADYIREQADVDVFEIVPEVAYPAAYNECISYVNDIEIPQNLRPAYKNDITNLADYETVFIGGPIWWARPPMIIRTFMEAHPELADKTIIPFAGIASWYDYTNSQGAPIRFDVNFADYLSAFNCGGTFLDNDWTVQNDDYGSWLWQIAQDQDATNGDYAPVWAMSDYSGDYEDIQCSALVVHGLNDFNVTTKQADLMMQAFMKAGKCAKLVLHQDGHNTLDNKIINGELWQELMNKWLSHWLYGVENGIEDMPAVSVQSNVDGSFTSYDAWRAFPYHEIPSLAATAKTTVNTVGFAEYSTEFLSGENPDLVGLKGQEIFYATLDEPYAGVYLLDIPEGTTIMGVPEVHLKLSTPVTDKDGLMITAVLVDYKADGTPFKAYMTKDRLDKTLPVKTVDSFDLGGGLGESDILEFVQSTTPSKCVTFGWTDLCNPGCGYDSSDYTESVDLEAGREYDYTFYMLPTAYTVAPGHRLQLVITAWDPYRAFLDEDYELDPTLPSEYSSFNYSFVIDNTSLHFIAPVAE